MKPPNDRKERRRDRSIKLPRGMPPRPRPGDLTEEGTPSRDLLGALRVEEVSIGGIDVADRTYQYRLSCTVEDLKASLRADGQHEPVHLCGTMPYRIVDGFRRIEAAQSLGWPCVKAFVHHDLAEVDAHVLAFQKNVVRRNLSPLERANAIAQAVRHGMTKALLARRLGLSERQILRYENLLTFPATIQQLVDSHGLTMRQARLLADAGVDDPQSWAQRVRDESWSQRELERELRKARGAQAAGRRPTYIKRGKNSLRFHAFKISRSAPKEERARVIGLLREAIDFLGDG